MELQVTPGTSAQLEDAIVGLHRRQPRFSALRVLDRRQRRLLVGAILVVLALFVFQPAGGQSASALITSPNRSHCSPLNFMS